MTWTPPVLKVSETQRLESDGRTIEEYVANELINTRNLTQGS